MGAADDETVEGNNTHNDEQLHNLGWQPHFSEQLIGEDEYLIPARISEVRGNGIHIVGEGIDQTIPPAGLKRGDVVVGDWVALNKTEDGRSYRPSRVLNRTSLMKRKASGPKLKMQLIAANLDTAFVVSSCNQDFNVARLERYVAMVLEADVTPVIVLTKRDFYDEMMEDDKDGMASLMLDSYLEEANGVAGNRDIPVVALDARGDEARDSLAEWCQPGQTVAFLGSSGVGKSTLVNSLCGTHVADTGAIHEDSGQGRHTTTRRQLFFLSNGCAVLDTPGLRELQLLDAAYGVSEVFGDIVELTRQCRFNDCRHAGEPGCAIDAAVENGELDEDRLARWEKLVAEDENNSKIIAESKARALSKEIRRNKERKNRRDI